jgi:hypothetical protein
VFDPGLDGEGEFGEGRGEPMPGSDIQPKLVVATATAPWRTGPWTRVAEGWPSQPTAVTVCAAQRDRSRRHDCPRWAGVPRETDRWQHQHCSSKIKGCTTLPTVWHQAPVLDLHKTDHPNPQVHDPLGCSRGLGLLVRGSRRLRRACQHSDRVGGPDIAVGYAGRCGNGDVGFGGPFGVVEVDVFCCVGRGVVGRVVLRRL